MEEKITAHDVVKQFMRTSKLRHASAEATIGSLGCHQSQHRILVALEMSDHLPISQRELANKLDITPAAVTVALKKMEKIGYISRVQSEDDSRVNNIDLTNMGRKLLAESKARFDGIDDVMLRGISDKEKASLIKILGKMQNNLQQLCSD